MVTTRTNRISGTPTAGTTKRGATGATADVTRRLDAAATLDRTRRLTDGIPDYRVTTDGGVRILTSGSDKRIVVI